MRAAPDDLPGVENDDPVGVRIVPTRCATMITVRSASSFASAARRRASVLKSSAEKLSSKTMIGARFTSARAIARRWRWPPDTFVPPW